MLHDTKQRCVYMLASRPNGTLYIGVTRTLFARTIVHREDLRDGFTKRYGVHRLVYYETHPTMEAAIRREKQLKKWNRIWNWKIRLIEEMNPAWADLFNEDEGIMARGPSGQSGKTR